MIDIDEIKQKKSYSYAFPTIDFKFQNAGKATAFLWQFDVEVLAIAIDLTPVLSFRAEITEHNELLITATNNGWGKIYNLQLHIEEPILSQIFTYEQLSYKDDIESGETKNVFRLNKENFSNEKFKSIKNHFRLHQVNDYKNKYKNKFVRGIQVQDIKIEWSGNDDVNTKYNNEQIISPGGFLSDVFLTNNGFVEKTQQVAFQMAESDITYISMINTLKGVGEQIYPISRKIPPGDVERFHIMIGASQSCHAKVRFRFHIDKSEIVKSEEFEISIWNPRHSHWHFNYADGDELKRDLETYHSFPFMYITTDRS